MEMREVGGRFPGIESFIHLIVGNWTPICSSHQIGLRRVGKWWGLQSRRRGQLRHGLSLSGRRLPTVRRTRGVALPGSCEHWKEGMGRSPGLARSKHPGRGSLLI